MRGTNLWLSSYFLKGGRRGYFPFVVHPAGSLLAAGYSRRHPVSDRLAPALALPLGRDYRQGRIRASEGNHSSACKGSSRARSRLSAKRARFCGKIRGFSAVQVVENSVEIELSAKPLFVNLN